MARHRFDDGLLVVLLSEFQLFEDLLPSTQQIPGCDAQLGDNVTDFAR